MNEASSAFITDTTRTETFEFLIGLTEQRCMVLHPGSIRVGFVDEGELVSEPKARHGQDRSDTGSGAPAQVR
jgi:hypothetical protein